MLEVKNLHAKIGEKEILKDQRWRDACYHGTQWLGQVDAECCARR